MADSNGKISSEDIQKIPNSVSGDGRTFVAQLKKALLKFAGNVSSSVSEAIENTSTAYGQVTDITLLEEHTTDDLGYPENDVYVTWEKGTVTGYNGASVWYKAGTTGKYQYAGNANGITFTIKKLTAGTTYTVKVVGINKFSINCNFDAAPTADITVQGASHLPTAPDQFTVTWEGGTPHWQWTAVNTQDYFDGYELRENTDAGKYKGMLDSTSALTSDAVPSERSGTAYLFARSIFGTYGSPRTHAYNLAQPTAPTAPVIETLFQGFNIHMATLPANCTGIEILATNTSTKDEHSFYTKNDVFQIGILFGNYDFKYRYYDCFGNGEWSNVTNADVTTVIDSSLIGDMAISLQKVDKNLQQVFNTTIPAIESNVSDIQNTTIPAIESNVSDIQNTTIPAIESDITTLQNGITENANRITAIEKDVSGNATAINQNATDITSLAKAVNGNTTAIHQNADSITSLSETVNGNTSAIAQNSDSITALVKDGKGYASAIAQNTDSINTLVQDGKGYASAIAQNTDSINTLVQDGKGYASAIAQNTDSITSVVTNLGDSAKAKEAYSAIAQMQDDIALRVKSGEVVSQINLSKEGVQIDGKLLHVTGDTLFDKNVVVKNMIQAGAVTADKIGAYAVTADKIQSGSVTTDKLSANAVTAEKLAAESVTADKIISGAITTEKIAAGSVTAGKLGADSVLAENIKAGAVESDKLAAKAVTADKIKVDSLSAITANVGTLTGGTITGTTVVGSTIKNSRGTFSVTADGVVNGITINAGRINASVITQAGFAVKASSIISGSLGGPVSENSIKSYTIPLPSGYTESQCLWSAFSNAGVAVSMAGRSASCYDTSTDGNHVRYRNYTIYYRVIGIK